MRKLLVGPRGNKVAHRFPWWQSGVITIASTVATGTSFRFRQASEATAVYEAGRRGLFFNNQPWPVYINEIRFVLEHSTCYPLEWMFPYLLARMNSVRDGVILREGVPITALASQQGWCSFARPGASIFTLPADFYLTAEDELAVDIPSNTAGVTGNVQVAVRGFDPYTRAPVIRSSDYAAIAAGGTSFAFASGRDKSVKDMWVRDLVIGGTAFSAGDARILPIRVTPPSGPKWTDDFETRIVLISDNPPVATGWSLADLKFASIVYRPVTPYIMLPADKFDIEIQLAEAASHFGISGSVNLHCCLRGYQEVPDDNYR